VDRTTSPWRALEDPGFVSPEADPASARLPARQRLLVAGLLGIAVAVALAALALLTVLGPASTVSVSTAGGDSPSLGPGDSAGSVVAGGDGGGPSGQNPDGSDGPGTGGAAADGSAPPVELVVEVAGAVARPGLYHLAAGARVADAIAAAGGYGPRIDVSRATAELNLAARVGDGDRIIVPSRDGPFAQTTPSAAPGDNPSGSSAPARSGPLNLNTATAAELDALPGIGPVTLAKIIASRTQQPFRSVADLRTRKLVGAAELDQIQKLVTVR
jgi:competence protein ComEA